MSSSSFCGWSMLSTWADAGPRELWACGVRPGCSRLMQAALGCLEPRSGGRCAACPGRAPGPRGTPRWLCLQAGRSPRAAGRSAWWELPQDRRAGLWEAPEKAAEAGRSRTRQGSPAVGLPSEMLGREPGTTMCPVCAKKVTLPEGGWHGGVCGGGRTAEVIPDAGGSTRAWASPPHGGDRVTSHTGSHPVGRWGGLQRPRAGSGSATKWSPSEAQAAPLRNGGSRAS